VFCIAPARLIGVLPLLRSNIIPAESVSASYIYF